jgi:hypothetical protein
VRLGNAPLESAAALGVRVAEQLLAGGAARIITQQRTPADQAIP